MLNRPRGVLAAILALGPAGCTTAELTHDSRFDHVNVVDVVTGAVLVDRTVVIDSGRITAILDSGSSRTAPAATVVDARGKYMIPGLWDMHVHLADSSYLARFIANGITGVRDMGGGLESPGDGCESLKPATLQAWRTSVERGDLAGPQIMLSGPAVSGTGSSSSLPGRTPAEATSAVAQLGAMGVDFIKVYEKLPLQAYLALANAAKASGLVFSGHVPEETVGLLDAINAGQRSIEHIRAALLMCFAPDTVTLEKFFARDHWSPGDKRWGRLRYGECQDVLAAARTSAVWFTPTLLVEHAKVAVDDPQWVEKRAHAWLPKSVRDAHSRYFDGKRAQTPTDRASDHLWWETQELLVARLNGSGAALLAGTDAGCEGGVPGEALHRELELLVDAGLSPRQALQTATVQPARYFGTFGSQGIVATGAQAELVLLDANPLEDISNTRRIHGVVLRGTWMDAGRLAALRR